MSMNGPGTSGFPDERKWTLAPHRTQKPIPDAPRTKRGMPNTELLDENVGEYPDDPKVFLG